MVHEFGIGDDVYHLTRTGLTLDGNVYRSCTVDVQVEAEQASNKKGGGS